MACLHFDFGILASRPMNVNFVFSHQVCGEMFQSRRETDGGMVVISKGDLESLGHSLSCLHESFSSFHLPPPIPHLEPLKEESDPAIPQDNWRTTRLKATCCVHSRTCRRETRGQSREECLNKLGYLYDGAHTTRATHSHKDVHSGKEARH